MNLSTLGLLLPADIKYRIRDAGVLGSRGVGSFLRNHSDLFSLESATGYDDGGTNVILLGATARQAASLPLQSVNVSPRLRAAGHLFYHAATVYFRFYQGQPDALVQALKKIPDSIMDGPVVEVDFVLLHMHGNLLRLAVDGALERGELTSHLMDLALDASDHFESSAALEPDAPHAPSCDIKLRSKVLQEVRRILAVNVRDGLTDEDFQNFVKARNLQERHFEYLHLCPSILLARLAYSNGLKNSHNYNQLQDLVYEAVGNIQKEMTKYQNLVEGQPNDAHHYLYRASLYACQQQLLFSSANSPALQSAPGLTPVGPTKRTVIYFSKQTQVLKIQQFGSGDSLVIAPTRAISFAPEQVLQATFGNLAMLTESATKPPRRLFCLAGEHLVRSCCAQAGCQHPAGTGPVSDSLTCFQHNHEFTQLTRQRWPKDEQAGFVDLLMFQRFKVGRSEEEWLKAYPLLTTTIETWLTCYRSHSAGPSAVCALYRLAILALDHLSCGDTRASLRDIANYETIIQIYRGAEEPGSAENLTYEIFDKFGESLVLTSVRLELFKRQQPNSRKKHFVFDQQLEAYDKAHPIFRFSGVIFSVPPPARNRPGVISLMQTPNTQFPLQVRFQVQKIRNVDGSGILEDLRGKDVNFILCLKSGGLFAYDVELGVLDQELLDTPLLVPAKNKAKPKMLRLSLSHVQHNWRCPT